MENKAGDEENLIDFFLCLIDQVTVLSNFMSCLFKSPALEINKYIQL